MEHIDFTEAVETPPQHWHRLTSQEFAQRRQRLGLSYTELAKWMRVSYSAVHSWENRPDKNNIPLWVPIVLDYLELRRAVSMRKSADIALERIMLAAE